MGDCIPKDFKSLEAVTEEIFGYVRGIGTDLRRLGEQIGTPEPDTDGVYSTIGEPTLLAKWTNILAMLANCRDDLNHVMDVVGKSTLSCDSDPGRPGDDRCVVFSQPKAKVKRSI